MSSNRLPNFLDSLQSSILDFYYFRPSGLVWGTMTVSKCTLACIYSLLVSLTPSAGAQSTSFEKIFRDGTTEMRAGHLEAAAQDFTKAVELSPGFAEAHFNLGLVLLQQKRFNDAASSLNRSLILKPRLRGANLFLGIACYRRNEYDKAIAALTRETKIDASSAQAFMWLGVVQLAKGDAGSAVSSLDRAFELKPDDVDILYHRGRAHMLVSKTSYEQLYTLSPDSWRVHQILSQSFAEADRLDDAIAEAQLAIKLKPDEPGLHEELGNLYWQLNKLADAETEFQKELEADTESTDSMYKLGVISIERSKPEVAAKLLGDVLKRTPHSADAEYQLGRAEAQMGSLDDAVHQFELAVSDSHNVATETLRQSYYQLAQLYRRQQKPQESRAALDSFMRLKQQADAEQAQNLQGKLRRSAELQQPAR
jgi:tetratricopeptide (TPR) repeat protein